jgi:hypothetical protein
MKQKASINKEKQRKIEETRCKRKRENETTKE